MPLRKNGGNSFNWRNAIASKRWKNRIPYEFFTRTIVQKACDKPNHR